ncbi:phenylalanine--tRNA ligase subunit alpha [Spiroplasma turonicum]|uniref:Phenylalanine--tRNA ligase alpha subunit n=1 Tax=Spiroplasma turonicum TaxID=216946 RepID=A0A0K1P5A6_9MOLU|nr:phenylalanine--tRNA ligase subunit alpha [Spiroplasma turonicum]AKU79475.1 phenylalanyl-tRNA synthetase subunit alpha [Spiroplasma turonicum]ALX70496.1 phenylalanyl-tRNA synthetase subunit alpha [Spiroplasma turonicum]
MVKNIEIILERFKKRIDEVQNKEELELIKKEFLGKDSEMNDVLRNIRSSSNEEKKLVGQKSNEAKNLMIKMINDIESVYESETLKNQLKTEIIDQSLPGISFKKGSVHPLNLVVNEVCEIFKELGYKIVSGLEFETDEYCFQKLNIPVGHPARDMQDTFYVDNKSLLRTHATNVTSRMLTFCAENKIENMAVLSYGNVYRRDDDDATHSHQFMQMDVFAIGKTISFANLKWLLQHMCKRLFSEDTKIRLRPSFFPFTEPSAEVDVECISCKGKGCSICKNTGYIEILGSGMINPEVLMLNGLDPDKITGLAFGVGIERIAMLKYNLKNIRDLYENDIRFLEQFTFFGD